MGLITQNSRIAHHRVDTPGSIFTIPASSDFTDGTWLITDLNLGELGINMVDDRIFFRTNNGIIEIETASGLNALWKRDGENIRAIENALTSPLIYPDILPPIDGVSSLGNAFYAWKDIHISGNFTQGTRNGLTNLNSAVFGGSVLGNEASGDNSFSFGDNNISSAANSFSFGSGNLASGVNSYVEGLNNISSGIASHAEGGLICTASGDYSHAEGSGTTASDICAHSEGAITIASAYCAHAEGVNTLASSTAAHAEGSSTIASNGAAHAEGDTTQATGFYSHSEGSSTIASGIASHSEGSGTTASGDNSHSGGVSSISNHYAEWSRSSGADAQYGKVSFERRTTNNTITEIFLDGLFSLAGSLRFTVAVSTAYKVRIYANAIIDSGGNIGSVAVFSGSGTIKNIAGTTTLLNPITMTQDEADAAIAAATMTVTADNTNDSLKVQVTGITSENIRWFVKVDYEKIAY